MSVQFSSSSLDDRVSLFNRLMDNHRTFRKKFLLHRLVVVCHLPPGLADRRAVGAHYERFIYSQQRSRAGEDVTGLLLIYPKHALHIMECSTEVLLSVMQDLKHMQENTDSAVILKTRVLLVSHDISTRLFQRWNFTVLNARDSRLTVSSDEQNSEKLLIQTLHEVMGLGSHLLTAEEKITECKEISEEVLQESHSIPPQTAVCRLIQMEALLSPAQYINTYHTPVHQLLDSESVWPAVEHLQIL